MAKKVIYEQDNNKLVVEFDGKVNQIVELMQESEYGSKSIFLYPKELEEANEFVKAQINQQCKDEKTEKENEKIVHIVVVYCDELCIEMYGVSKVFTDIDKAEAFVKSANERKNGKYYRLVSRRITD